MIDTGIFSGKKICVAVSGGADSMALLHMLKKASESGNFCLSAVNCEHGIRGQDSIEDTAFVAKMCQEWGVPLYTFSEDCVRKSEREKISIETAARNFRYGVFEELLRSGKADLIATAHHADDDAETVLFRLCRGTSLSGVRGIDEAGDKYIRPLLGMTKAEILAYVRENEIPFRTDKSNFEKDATRNCLRLEILPALEKLIPGASGALLRFSSLAAEDDALLYELSEKLIVEDETHTFSEAGYYLDLSDKELLKSPLLRRAALAVMKKIGIEKDYTTENLNAVCALIDKQTGKRVCLPRGFVAERLYDKIIFTASKQPQKATDDFCENFRFGQIEGGRYAITVSKEEISATDTQKKTLVFDADKLPSDAVFRYKREGDTFEKFGGGTKSLKKYLTDKKIPSAVREDLPLIAERSGNRVFIVCGVEISGTVKVTAETANKAYIVIGQK